jgi:alpha/beta superfamily hydrolase
MAHGFSGTMDWIVPDFAAKFADGGLAALTFDYRYLGESEGEPRQLISTRKQCDDLRRAVAFARSRQEIDASRIAYKVSSRYGPTNAYAATRKMPSRRIRMTRRMGV